MTANTQYRKIGTIELLEDATCVFRAASAGVLIAYYIGAMPFVLGLLYFQGDMSLNPFAADHCTAASLAIAVLFIWMKCWQAVFLVKIHDQLYDRPTPSKWSIASTLRLAIIQVIIQPSGLFLLPLAAGILLPYAWVHAFYQNALTCRFDEPLAIRALLKKSWQQAAWQPVQNNLLLGCHFLFGMFVMLNVCAGLVLLPMMLKTFLDIETRFSMSAYSMLNTTFLFTAAGITYLCVDPLVKISYALRGIHASSIQTGEDLKLEFKSFTKQANHSLAAGLILVACLSGLLGSESRADVHPAQKKGPVTAEALNQSIETVMARPEFAWRLPRDAAGNKKENNGFLREAIEWLAQQIKKASALFERIKRFFQWLKKLLPEVDWTPKKKKDTGFSLDVRSLFILFSIGMVCFLIAWTLRRMLSSNKQAADDAPDMPQFTPNLDDETVRADQLPSDQWQIMAEELMTKGEFRLAMRAFYLCTLSFLGESRLLSIARYKSNYDYNRELNRRAHEKKDLLLLFKENILLFERSWYGMREVAREDVGLFRNNHERIVSFAK